MNYRRDIDGLRAVAVLAVVLYHLGFTPFKGGFVGVDVFFVISGYLITLSILNDLDKNRFTIEYFYIKRIRRIIPALFTVTLFTAVAGWWILPLSELKEFAKSIVSVATFTSNIFFWKNSDYFAVASELKPLLHTWSLGIEEQFYMFYPLLISWILLKKSQKLLIVILSVLTGLSFLWSISPWMINNPIDNFYLPFGRFWELLAGALLGFGHHRYNLKRVVFNNHILALFAISVIIYSINTTDTYFLAFNLLNPVIATLLVLHTGRYNQSGIIYHMLTSAFMRYIGLISYSLYLWHWPILALTRNLTTGEFSTLEKTVLLLITVLISSASYHYIEQPFRRGRAYTIVSFKSAFFAISFLIVSGLSIYIWTHLRQSKIPKINHNCFHKQETLNSTKSCSFGELESDKIFLLFGDSHANAIYPVFKKMAQEYGYRGIVAILEGCPPLFGVHREDTGLTASSCDGSFAKNVENFLYQNSTSIEKVFIVGRWSLYENGWIKNGRVMKATHFISDDTISAKTSKESRHVLKKAIQNSIQKIRKMGIDVIVIVPPPALNVDINRRFGVIPTKKEEYEKSIEHINKIVKQMIKRDKNITLINPVKLFCPNRYCLLYKDKKALYIDDNHLSTEGAYIYKPLLKPIFEKGENR